MERKNDILMFWGRLFLSLIFIMSAFGKIFAFNDTMVYMQAFGIVFATAFFVVVAILFELIGGLFILLGYKMKFGSLMLIVFMVIVTLIFHMNLSDQNQFIQFMKNLSVIGGLLVLLTASPGKISFDKD